MIAAIQNKRKILNDPVYGFINIPDDIIFDLIEHPWFQRLRRIKQMGLSHLIYPGALHTRFHHSIGAMHLANQTVQSLRLKGNVINDNELTGLCIAMLLHDLGHGPYSHNLERVIIPAISHEKISLMGIECLNKQFHGKLDTGLNIYKNSYPKHWLSQLVSGQLDLDRLDYLRRDSFYTGVSEGVISVERIIKMLNIVDDNIVVEEKGIYSIEKFIVARRLMYWQVYLHKTVLAAETMLTNTIRRARFLMSQNVSLPCSPVLQLFLSHSYTQEDFDNQPELLEQFMTLDDIDVFSAIKQWQQSHDTVLQLLSSSLTDRKLFRIIMRPEPFSQKTIDYITEKTMQEFNISKEESQFLITNSEVINNAFSPKSPQIRIIRKSGVVCNITDISEHLNQEMHIMGTVKHFLCFPKSIQTPKDYEL